MKQMYQMMCEDGFMVRSQNKKEVNEIGKMHVKKQHHQNTTDAEMNDMIKQVAVR